MCERTEIGEGRCIVVIISAGDMETKASIFCFDEEEVIS
jgi:hypothetical protein